MSKHTLVGGNGRELLDLLARLKTRGRSNALQRRSRSLWRSTEVGLDGFWIHRLLEANVVETTSSNPASIAVPRRHGAPRPDAIDGETLLRTLDALAAPASRGSVP